MKLTDALLRPLLRSFHQLMRLDWFVRRPRTYGAHAVALTPQRMLILVRLRYAPGWRLPGGGRNPGEDPQAAVLRELREEIGMTAHGSIRLAAELEEAVDFKRDLASVFIVEDVHYAPRWSWEVERIVEVRLDNLPRDMAPVACNWIAAVRDHL